MLDFIGMVITSERRRRTFDPVFFAISKTAAFKALGLVGFGNPVVSPRRNRVRCTESKMSPQIIFGTSVAFGLIAWSIVIVRYVWPLFVAKAGLTHCAPCSCFTASVSSALRSW